MANPIASTWRSFWHTMTSYDRHAAHDSPYRTGRHIPLPQSRHAPLTSVASATESRSDLPSALSPDESHMSNGSPRGPLSPNQPYSPGLRSSSTRQSTEDSEIQMQNFNDGLPPPPPVGHSWQRIDKWAERNYEELFDNLCEGCTQNDVNELEHELDCTLPQDVRESLQVHDGQERFGRPTGLFFGLMILDCEEVVIEWQNWRKVNEEFLSQASAQTAPPPQPTKTLASSSTSPPPSQRSQQANNPLWRQELLSRQESQPPNAIQKVYSHPGWIPLARDWGGNYLAVDLAPGPAGKWGQIIIYGRDYDCKYVIARSWGAFLAVAADDLNSSKVSINEDTGDLKLLEFKNAEPPYLEILRWRCDQKYGRRKPKKPNNTLQINANVTSPHNTASPTNISPYASPGSASEDRGRSPHRFGSKGPAPSPRAHISSPLARVAEELPSPESTTVGKLEKLVSIDTPRPSDELNGSDKENTATTAPSDEKNPKPTTTDLKTVDI